MNEIQSEHAAELRGRIFRIERLTTMPQVVWQLMDALADETAGGEKMAAVIRGDVALSAKVLSLANSAYYGQSREVTTIERAVVVIGLRELELLALGAGLAETFDLRHVPKEFDGAGLWVHCLAVGWAARSLAEASGAADPAEAMIAGLLHDLGKLVLATYLSDEFTKVMEMTAAGTPYHRAEQEIGVDHGQVGFILARKWSLPDVLAAVLRDHHRFREAEEAHRRAVALVALADTLVKGLGLGLVHESASPDMAAALKETGLNAKQYAMVVAKAAQELREMVESWQAVLRDL